MNETLPRHPFSLFTEIQTTDTISIVLDGGKQCYLMATVVNVKGEDVNHIYLPQGVRRVTMSSVIKPLYEVIRAWRQGLRFSRHDLTIVVLDKRSRRLPCLERYFLDESTSNEDNSWIEKLELGRLYRVNLTLFKIL